MMCMCVCVRSPAHVHACINKCRRNIWVWILRSDRRTKGRFWLFQTEGKTLRTTVLLSGGADKKNLETLLSQAKGASTCISMLDLYMWPTMAKVDFVAKNQSMFYSLKRFDPARSFKWHIIYLFMVFLTGVVWFESIAVSKITFGEKRNQSLASIHL